MRKARIYKPSKNVMQSGRAKTEQWVLEYDNRSNRSPDPLMGWTQSEDTLSQIRLKFNTLEAAMAYAEKNGVDYYVAPQHERKVKPRNYGDNFKYVATASPPPAKTPKKAPAKSAAKPKTTVKAKAPASPKKTTAKKTVAKKAPAKKTASKTKK